ncbi:MAG: AAA family ATPase [Gemmataceae bacterium]|jgi:MoxR-like ATPase|nr:AAA family ATPase [Planctomycetota bacterium]
MNPAPDQVEAMKALGVKCQKLRAEVAKAIIGQDAVIEQLLWALLSRGHALLVGVPGLAKTLMVSTLAQALHLSFKRIQFTPDLMPTDITGSEVIQDDPVTRQRVFKFMPGPIFTNVLLADEINRTPPKTQAALLEAMQERKATIGGTDHPLPKPFFVLATQNPIEQEGTYPLPEAQLDRFLVYVRVDYPTESEETEIMTRSGLKNEAIQAVLDGADLETLQELTRQVIVSPAVTELARRLVRMSRPNTPEAAPFAARLIQWGAGPRAGAGLLAAARARAALAGRFHVTPKDIEAVAAPVLRHRIIPSYIAQGDGIDSDKIIAQLLAAARQATPAATT